MQNDATPFIVLSEDMAFALRQLQQDDTQETAAEEPADDARQLLRWLDNLPSAEMPLDEWLDSDAPQEALGKAGNLSQLVKIFIRKLKRARQKRPDIMRAEPMVEDAAHAAAAMTQAVIEHALAQLPEHHPQAAKLEALLTALPPQAAMRQAQSVKRVTLTMQAGMERAGKENVSGKSAPERLVEISTQLQATARKLRSIDSLEPPAREESIELAREILRRLKNLGFSDKPIKQMIDAGDLQDKMAFAQQIDEMADMYKNLLQEAAQINPNILQDQRVKEAGEAVATFVHGVKLMAAKEMPGSIAAAQQISADATHNPAEWDRLGDRTVGRLVKSMEGALEKAAGDIEAEQEQQRQDDEQAQQQADAAVQHSDQTKRKKRKRRSSKRSSGGGGKKQQKEKMAMEADDYVLKQGRFSKDAKTARIESPAAMPGLTPEALAAVRQLGGALLSAGNQAKDLSAALAAVAPADTIAPDDKTAAQRIKDEQKNPRNNQRPRV